MIFARKRLSVLIADRLLASTINTAVGFTQVSYLNRLLANNKELKKVRKLRESSGNTDLQRDESNLL